MKKLTLYIIACVSALAPFTSSAIPVGLELALLTDISGSVNNREYRLQKNGYVAAFQDASIQAAISTIGGIAVSYYEWSGARQQATKVEWFNIVDAASSNDFAALIKATKRSFNGGMTAPGNAIKFVTPLFGTETGGKDNGFESSRQVIDISGDGRQNSGKSTSKARDAALASGVDAINGLPVLGEKGLRRFYEKNIQGGTDSFIIPAANFSRFKDKIKQKIAREIAVFSAPAPAPALAHAPESVPGPAFLTLLGIGLVGFIVHRRKINAPR